MSTFVANDTIERISWDFTDTPSITKGKKVTGQHVIGELPEPDPQTAAAFLDKYEDYLNEGIKAARASYYHDRQLERRAAGLADDDEDEQTPDLVSSGELYERQDTMGREALELIGVPTALIKQLPSRLVLAFLRHVAKELVGEGDAAPSND